MSKKFLDIQSFSARYPLDRKIASGSYGSVYLSGNDTVVKGQQSDTSAILKEIDIFNRFSHPCIIPLLNYTVYFENGVLTSQMAFPKGKPLKNAITDGDITPDKFVYDILSALSLLHQSGIIHGDIKPDNIVFYRGYACLIDFGLAKRIYNTAQGKMITGISYSLPYRDPEYNGSAFNPINVELYSVGASLIKFYDPNPLTGLIIESKKLPELMRRLTTKLAEREFLSQIVPQPIPGQEFETLPIDIHRCDEEVFLVLYQELVNVNQQIPIEPIFLACQIIHRSYPILRKMRYHNLAIVQTSLYLSINLNWDNAYTMRPENRNCVIDMINILEGIIWTTTILDFIPLDSSVLNAFGEIMSCHYRYPHYRFRNHNTGNKLQTIGQLREQIISIKEVVNRSVGPITEINPRIHLQPFDVNLHRPPVSFNKMNENLRRFLRFPDLWQRLELLELTFCCNYQDLKDYTAEEGVELFNLINTSKSKELLYWYFTGELYRSFPPLLSSASVNPFAIRTEQQIREYFPKN